MTNCKNNCKHGESAGGRQGNSQSQQRSSEQCCRGERGRRGERGKRGHRGKDGKDGKDGIQDFAEAFVLGDIRVNSSNCPIKFTNCVVSDNDDFKVDGGTVHVCKTGTYKVEFTIFVPANKETNTQISLNVNGCKVKGMCVQVKNTNKCSPSLVYTVQGIICLKCGDKLTLTSGCPICLEASDCCKTASLTLLRLK